MLNKRDGVGKYVSRLILPRETTRRIQVEEFLPLKFFSLTHGATSKQNRHVIKTFASNFNPTLTINKKCKIIVPTKEYIEITADSSLGVPSSCRVIAKEITAIACVPTYRFDRPLHKGG